MDAERTIRIRSVRLRVEHAGTVWLGVARASQGGRQGDARDRLCNATKRGDQSWVGIGDPALQHRSGWLTATIMAVAAIALFATGGVSL